MSYSHFSERDFYKILGGRLAAYYERLQTLPPSLPDDLADLIKTFQRKLDEYERRNHSD